MANPTNPGSDNPDIRAIEMIKASGILNPNATLDKIMDLATKMSAETMEPTEAEGAAAVKKHTDTFIHSHFIYKHES